MGQIFVLLHCREIMQCSDKKQGLFGPVSWLYVQACLDRLTFICFCLLLCKERWWVVLRMRWWRAHRVPCAGLHLAAAHPELLLWFWWCCHHHHHHRDLPLPGLWRIEIALRLSSQFSITVYKNSLSIRLQEKRLRKQLSLKWKYLLEW